MICFCSCAEMKALKDISQFKKSVTEWGGRKIELYFAGEDTVLVVKYWAEQDI